MRVPTRKGGKYTHLKADPHITKAKHEELKNSLEKMKKRRPALIKEVKRLGEMGDFSENTAYQIAKGRLRGLNQKILDTEDCVKTAIIINSTQNNTVQLGSRVSIEIDGKEKTYIILGPSETNPIENIISHLSPLGSALMGRRVEDKIKFKIKDKIKYLKIIKII